MSNNSNLIQLNELEKLSNIIYSSNDISTVNYSNELIERFINTNYSFKCLFEYFFETNNTLTYFWIIDVLIKIVNKSFVNMDKDEILYFQQCLYEIFSKGFIKYGNSNQPFIINKIALLIVTWIKFNYPDNNQTLFDDYLNLSINVEEAFERNTKIELFLIILITFNDEYLKFRHILNSFDEHRSTLIKDSLRVDPCLINILKVLNSIILLNNESFPEKLTILSLKVSAQLIDWNNIQLFQDIIISSQKILNNAKFTKLILELFSALVNKGMNLNEKINLLKCLDILNLIESFVKNKKVCLECDCLTTLSEMVINLGLYFSESLVLIEKTSEFEEVILNSLSIINFLVIKSTEIVEVCMMNEEVKTSLTHTDLFKSIIELIKRISPELSNKIFECLDILIRFLIRLLRIPENINIITDMELRKNEDYKNFRKDFLVILQSLFQVNILKDHIINLISEKIILVKSKNNQLTLYDIELVLYLCTNIDVTTNTSIFFFESILNIPFYEYESETILLEYLESLVKFINCYVNNNQIVDSIAKLFISEKGLLYPNLKISSKISLILLKFIEKSRNNMDSNICLMMIDNVKKILHEITKTNNSKIINDFSSIYQSFGILINSLKANNEDLKKDCYIEIFSIFLGYFGIKVDFANFMIMNEGEKIELDKFLFVSKLVLNFLKSFNSEIKFDKLIFVNFFKIFFFKIFKSIDMSKYNSQTITSTHTTIINILQKILILLTNDSLDIIEYFILNEFNNCSTDIFEQTIKLLINLTNLMKKDSYLMIEKTLSILVNSVQNLGYPKTLISDNEKMIVNLYGHITKLISNICNDFIEVIFESSLKNFNFIGFLINTSVNIIDQNIKRTSFKCLKSMVTYLIKFTFDDYLVWSITILDFSFSFIRILDLNNPIDMSTFGEIMICHQICYKTNNKFYIGYIEKTLNDISLLNLYLDNLNKLDCKKSNSLEVNYLREAFTNICQYKSMLSNN